jgi:hypothetical protein
MMDDIIAIFWILMVVGIMGAIGWLCVWTIRRNTWAGVFLTVAIFGILMIAGALRQ